MRWFRFLLGGWGSSNEWFGFGRGLSLGPVFVCGVIGHRVLWVSVVEVNASTFEFWAASAPAGVILRSTGYTSGLVFPIGAFTGAVFFCAVGTGILVIEAFFGDVAISLAFGAADRFPSVLLYL